MEGKILSINGAPDENFAGIVAGLLSRLTHIPVEREGEGEGGGCFQESLPPTPYSKIQAQGNV